MQASAMNDGGAAIGHWDRDKMILTVLIGGFAMTAIEVRYLHGAVVSEHAVAWTPTIVSALGAVMCLLALGASRRVKAIALVVLGFITLSGLAGLYFHTELKPSAFAKLFTAKTPVAEAESRSDEDDFATFEKKAESEGGAPALAPLGISGLAAIGVLVIGGQFADRKRQNKQRRES